MMRYGFQEWTMQESRHKQESRQSLREEGMSRYDLGS